MQVRFFLGFFLLMSFVPVKQAQALVIQEDRGGRIGSYIEKYEWLRNSGEKVVIDGLCASACTLVLSLPKNQFCATPRAVLAFHQAYDTGSASVGGKLIETMIPNSGATELLFRAYPKLVRTWINMHNGMPEPSRLLILKGHALARFVPPCIQPNYT